MEYIYFLVRGKPVDGLIGISTCAFRFSTVVL